MADSSYQYLLVGNFFDDSNTDTIHNPPFSAVAYYYIDDSLVIHDTLTALVDLADSFGLKIFPNPCKYNLSISINHTDISEIEIFDVQAKRIKYIAEIINVKLF